ncbi:MAG: cbb3-type cytochrome oxidase assembly protein CcoS [Pseudomonadota bacterium]
MSIAYLLVSLGLGVFALAVWAMFWAIDSGQFDELDSRGEAIFDESELTSVPRAAAKKSDSVE